MHAALKLFYINNFLVVVITDGHFSFGIVIEILGMRNLYIFSQLNPAVKFTSFHIFCSYVTELNLSINLYLLILKVLLIPDCNDPRYIKQAHCIPKKQIYPGLFSQALTSSIIVMIFPLVPSYFLPSFLISLSPVCLLLLFSTLLSPAFVLSFHCPLKFLL